MRYQSTTALLAGLASLGAASANDNCDTSISWKSCSLYKTTIPMECANFTVPLDYKDKKSNETLKLELARIPATKGKSKGSILMNFGGPGEPGRLGMAAASPLLVAATGGEYDLVTWDPRGTVNTLPFSCFKQDALRASFLASFPQWSDSSEVAPGYQWAAAGAFADICLATANKTGELIGTAYTARDMMQIVDALGEDGKLRYWGISYGTTLGATVNAMFPERMDKVLLDAVYNPFEYYYDYNVEEYAQTDKSLTGFAEACAKVGPKKCAFAKPGDTGAKIEKRIYDLYEDLRKEPLYVPETGGLVTYDVARSLVLGAMYSPASFPSMAVNLEALRTVNGTHIAGLFAASAKPDNTSATDEWNQGIACGDKWARADSLDEFMPVNERAWNVSKFGGGNVGRLGSQCARWKMPAKERYDGNFEAKTKNGVLLIANSYDPVAPVVSAKNLSMALEGSSVLIQDGFGHGSVAQASKCTTKVIQNFFKDGTLPKSGTHCPVDEELFATAA